MLIQGGSSGEKIISLNGRGLYIVQVCIHSKDSKATSHKVLNYTD